MTRIATTTLLLSLAAVATRAWTPVAHHRLGARVRVARASIEDERLFAEATSSKFGEQSREARVAWEAVEEMENKRGANARISAPALDEECNVQDAAIAEKCREFSSQMEQLHGLMEGEQPRTQQIDLPDMDLSLSAAAVLETDFPIDEGAYQVAKTDAEAAVAQFGAESQQARAAWDIVNEIEAVGETAAFTTLADECAVEESDRCDDYNKKLADLQKIIDGQQ